MIIVNSLGLLLIALIIWWFWLYKPKDVNKLASDAVIVVIDGVYQPARIKLPANKPASISFLRQDESPCAAMVEFPDFNISEELPLGKNKPINLPAMAEGEYPFYCQMQMYKGILIVE